MQLLQRTMRTYLLYSFLVILVAIPVFYVIIHEMFMQDVNHVLHQRRDELVTKLNRRPDESAWSFLQDMDENIAILPQQPNADLRERIYHTRQYDREAHEMEPFRVLSSAVVIHGHLYRLVLRQSLIDSEDLSQGIVVTQAILLVILLSGLLLINRFQSRRIWQPFYSTLEMLKKFELDKNSGLSLSSGKIREFNDLNQAISQLVANNYQVYLNQKEFTENAAHEMQTPLAIFRSKLDLLLQNRSLNGEQADLIQSLSDAAERLTRLNKSLLLLSRIENKQYLETAQIELAIVVEKALSQLEDQARAKNIRIDASLNRSVVIKANPSLADILISNLVSNAIRHNVENGRIRITLEERMLVIANTGQPLVFDRDRIFDRFRKNPADSQSTGLGLAIVKQICEVYRYTVKYEFRVGEHILTVHFGGEDIKEY